MVLNFSDFGESLGTRKLGSEIRKGVILNISAQGKIVFDFRGIDVISNSFADECFGKLIDEIGITLAKQKTTFTNANSKVSFVIRKAMSDRLRINSKKASCS